MRKQVMRRAATPAMVLIFVAFAAALSSPMAQAAGNPLTPLRITPSSGCDLVTAYTAGTGLPAWSGPAPSCGADAFTLALTRGTHPRRGRSRAALAPRAAPCWRGPPGACPRERGWVTGSPPRKGSRSPR